MKIYCISGLGADYRAFQYLELQEHEMIHIPWIEPRKGELLPAYALRLIEPFNLSQPYILMGLSLGGMMSVEISKIHKPEKLILISSIMGKHELPKRLSFAGKLGLHKVVPKAVVKTPNPLVNYLFGAQSKVKQLLAEILKDTDEVFLDWALNAILNWQNTQTVMAHRIHGTNDHVLPVPMDRIQYPIKKGGHLMIVDHAREVSHAIRQILE